MVEALLRHGVDTKAQSTHELTAVQIALKNQHFEIQNLLSDHEERFVTFTLSCKHTLMLVCRRQWHVFSHLAPVPCIVL